MPPDLRGQYVLVAADAMQSLAQDGLRGGVAVVRGYVEEGDAFVQCRIYGLDAVVLGDRPVDPAQRRCTESEL